MRSDSKLLIFIFRSEKRMDLLMQSDFGPKSGDSTHRILESTKGIGF